MGKRPMHGRRFVRLAVLTTSMIALVATLQPPLSAISAPNDPQPVLQGDAHDILDADGRAGVVRPSAAQVRQARQLSSFVSWNQFATPQSLLARRGALARGLGSNAVTAARRFVVRNRGLFRLDAAEARAFDVLLNSKIGTGRVVLLRQRFGNLPAAHDGLLTVAVQKGSVVYASSSVSGATTVTNSNRTSATAAVVVAARDVGRRISASDVTKLRARGGTTAFKVKGFDTATAKLVAVPTPQAGVRIAWETYIVDNAARPLAVSHFVDAETSDVLLRADRVDYLATNPTWKVFPNTPPLDYSSTDTREVWCWDPAPGCDRAVNIGASPNPWDVIPPATDSTLTSFGNNARSVENWNSDNPFTKGTVPATPSPTRDYNYNWTNQWLTSKCDPNVFTTPERNDIDAAITNLFAKHNRMHDWAFFLGFTEDHWNLQQFNYTPQGLGNDPEKGNAQAGGIVGGPPNFTARDNANQITAPDGDPAPGVPGGETITNMYLWQPIAAAFYAPCVDGDFDMSVIAHEYTHAISNRMVAGPNTGLSGRSSRAMGESWSDLTAVEYLNEYGFAPVANENPFAVGPYVTGDPVAGIRNYGMNQSPLNFSDVGYDFVCNEAAPNPCVAKTQVHADGEIWSAANYDIRQALMDRYGAGDPALQASCADGDTPVTNCPGNRRWIQLVFDAYLLMATGTPTMIDARNAMIASDQVRFNGANADVLWNAFARNGFGENASQVNSDDADPVPSFESPHAAEATFVFSPRGVGGAINAQLFVGQYEARVTPIADTDPATALGDTFKLVPGTYDLLARANGHGTRRLSVTVNQPRTRTLRVTMNRNLASSFWGASATGDGVNLDKLIDDTESTNWAYLGPDPVGGKSVTVRLDPRLPSHQIERVQVSALLRPQEPADPGGDTGSQNRFTALRSFEIWTCRLAASTNCSAPQHFTKVFTSPVDAFPAIAPRPRAPDLILRSFSFSRRRATHVKLVVVTNQCTGTPAYQGEQDNDPRALDDCEDGSIRDTQVRAAELQVFLR